MKKHANLVDLVQSFPTSIHLQNSAFAKAFWSLLFLLFFEKGWTTLLACFGTAENEPLRGLDHIPLKSR